MSEGFAEAWETFKTLTPRPHTTPIPYKGALGLRELPPDITEQIMAGVKP